MKQSLGLCGISIVVMATAICLTPLTVSAHERSVAQVTAEDRQKEVEQFKQKAAEARQKVTEIRAEAKQRLDDAKRRVCANHQVSINKLMTRIIEQRQKQIDHISEISTRVQAFYVKQGHELANYDALVSDAGAKKAAAQAALDAAKPSATFACDGEGPKAELQAFRDKRSVVIAAIKDYRKSVKTLIEGVKSVQPDKEETQ